jgi:tRNA(Ile)-lysidine synthase
MQASLHARILESISRQRMLCAGETLGIAVSGGADSVALLRLMIELRDALGVRLVVLHFNHQFRGDEAAADARFVQDLAAAHGLGCESRAHDVRGAAQREGWNLEDAARRLRYGFFEELIARGQVTRVAVGHTADDQAETVLAHLLRGTGLTGLAGIHPILPLGSGAIVRPLLEIRKQELREYLAAVGQTWREDLSNDDTTRLRARIRHGLLPILEKDFEAQVVPQLCRLASLAGDEEAFWDYCVGAALANRVTREASGAIAIRAADLLQPLGVAAFGALPAAQPSATGASASVGLSRRIVRRICQELRGGREGLTARHADQVLRLARQPASASGAETHLPGVRVERNFEMLRFSAASRSSAAIPGPRAARAGGAATRFEYSIRLDDPGPSEIVVPEIGRRVRFKLIDWPQASRETSMRHGALDRDRLRSPLVVRSWLPGDCFRPSGRRHIRKLKRLLLESRISLRDRAGWPVLTSAGKIVWARGFPVAADFAAAAGTEVGVLIEEELL